MVNKTQSRLTKFVQDRHQNKYIQLLLNVTLILSSDCHPIKLQEIYMRCNIQLYKLYYKDIKYTRADGTMLPVGVQCLMFSCASSAGFLMPHLAKIGAFIQVCFDRALLDRFDYGQGGPLMRLIKQWCFTSHFDSLLSFESA